MEIKPPFRICGTKTKKSLEIAKAFIDAVDRKDLCFVEPFCGSASVSLVSGHNSFVLNDAQILVAQLHLAIKHHPEEFARSFKEICDWYLIDPTDERYIAIRDQQYRFNEEGIPVVDRAAWFKFITLAGYNWVWRVNKKGFCNTPHGDKVKKVKKGIDMDDLMAYHQWLQGATICSFDFSDFLEQLSPSEKVIYVDPPYPGTFDQYTSRPMKGRFTELYRSLKKRMIFNDHVIIHSSVDRELSSRLMSLFRVFVYHKKTIVQPSSKRKDLEMIAVTRWSIPEDKNFSELGIVEVQNESHLRELSKPEEEK